MYEKYKNQSKILKKNTYNLNKNYDEIKKKIYHKVI